MVWAGRKCSFTLEQLGAAPGGFGVPKGPSPTGTAGAKGPGGPTGFGGTPDAFPKGAGGPGGFGGILAALADQEDLAALLAGLSPSQGPSPATPWQLPPPQGPPPFGGPGGLGGPPPRQSSPLNRQALVEDS